MWYIESSRMSAVSGVRVRGPQIRKPCVRCETVSTHQSSVLLYSYRYSFLFTGSTIAQLPVVANEFNFSLQFKYDIQDAVGLPMGDSKLYNTYYRRVVLCYVRCFFTLSFWGWFYWKYQGIYLLFDTKRIVFNSLNITSITIVFRFFSGTVQYS